MKRYIVIAGVNGAGKTTFFSSEASFNDIAKINLDEEVRKIGSWQDPTVVIAAGRTVVARINQYFDEGITFSQETTLCGKSIMNSIRKAKRLGYAVEVYYVGLDSVDTAKARVHYRVSRGGHGIPDEDIERRYYESIDNLVNIIPICDSVYVYDNTQKFKRIAVYENGIAVWFSNSIPKWFPKDGCH